MYRLIVLLFVQVVLSQTPLSIPSHPNVGPLDNKPDLDDSSFFFFFPSHLLLPLVPAPLLLAIGYHCDPSSIIDNRGPVVQGPHQLPLPPFRRRRRTPQKAKHLQAHPTTTGLMSASSVANPLLYTFTPAHRRMCPSRP